MYLAGLSFFIAMLIAVFGGEPYFGDIPGIAEIFPTPSETKAPDTDLDTENENTAFDDIEPILRAGFYRVVRVVDGDTLALHINGKTETIRLIGVDAPESVRPGKPVECFGKEASVKLKELLEGGQVRLEQDITQDDKDRYGRLLRYVFLEDGRLANQLILEEGYAYEYTYEAPYAYQAEFKAAEERARSGKHGLWADKACAG